MGTSADSHTMRTVAISIDPHKIDAKSINAVLERLYTEAGCRTCGLNGFDVRLQVIDPALQVQLPNIQGVLGVATSSGLAR